MMDHSKRCHDGISQQHKDACMFGNLILRLQPAAIAVQGYAAGFPVLLPTQLSRATSAAALQYLLDGNYLDKQSKQLTAELLTYNADLRVIGYAHMTFAWQRDGSISGVPASAGLEICSSMGGSYSVVSPHQRGSLRGMMLARW
jgi:hypothetical protein